VLVDKKHHTLTKSILISWFQKDFSESKDLLPQTIVQFLCGEKKKALLQIIDTVQQNKMVPIAVKLFPYNWAANASRSEPYDAGKLKAKEFMPRALLHFDGIGCITPAAAS
jgi:hypothetical protein